MRPEDLRIEDYTYSLTDERIARYPLPERDASKLLVYEQGHIREQLFRDLPDALPEESIILLNQTKVVHARLLFRKPSGGGIEVFCLEPHGQYADITTAMAQTESVWWHCLIGGAGKWKHGMILKLESAAPAFSLYAKIVDRNAEDFTIELRWDPPGMTFAEILKAAGKVPLPPYLHREAEVSDEDRYQTMFAAQEGSVAAPTASLHFTPAVMEGISRRGIRTGMLTLHVGAGTFQPVKSETIGGHEMHAEWMEVSEDIIHALLAQQGKPVVAVGTTALRTVESLYWIGCKLVRDPELGMEEMHVGQWEPYDIPMDMPARDALHALLQWMQQNKRNSIISKTQILLAPGYTFRIADGLITNFHQPRSTLLLLVAAFIGEDWRRVYEYALKNDFRFLSYGDSSLLWRNSG